jgi:hypothetical protein
MAAYRAFRERRRDEGEELALSILCLQRKSIAFSF